MWHTQLVQGMSIAYFAEKYRESAVGRNSIERLHGQREVFDWVVKTCCTHDDDACILRHVREGSHFADRHE